MYKRMLIVIVFLIASAGMLTRDVVAGPPWPAEVVQIREGDFCNFPWMNSNYEIIQLTGTGMWTAQYRSGQVQWNCHTHIDYDDPYLLSLDELCMVVPDYCNGNGAFIWRESDPIPLDCWWWDYLANDSIIVANDAGQVNISCHFNIDSP